MNPQNDQLWTIITSSKINIFWWVFFVYIAQLSADENAKIIEAGWKWEILANTYQICEKSHCFKTFVYHLLVSYHLKRYFVVYFQKFDKSCEIYEDVTEQGVHLMYWMKWRVQHTFWKSIFLMVHKLLLKFLSFPKILTVNNTLRAKSSCN